MALAEGSSLGSRTNMERIRTSFRDPKPSSDSTRIALMDRYPYTHVFKNKIHRLNIPKSTFLFFSLLAFVASFGQRTGLCLGLLGSTVIDFLRSRMHTFPILKILPTQFPKEKTSVENRASWDFAFCFPGNEIYHVLVFPSRPKTTFHCFFWVFPRAVSHEKSPGPVQGPQGPLKWFQPLRMLVHGCGCCQCSVLFDTVSKPTLNCIAWITLSPSTLEKQKGLRVSLLSCGQWPSYLLSRILRLS